MKFRRATNRDVEAIRNVVFTTLREYGLAPEPGATDQDLGDVEGFYGAGKGYFEVCEDNGEIIATWGIAPLSDGCCELRKMYLLAAHRGKGIGRTMLDRAVAKARELGFEKIELETASVLKEAISLYRKYGFRPVEGRPVVPRCDQAYELWL